MDTPHTDLGGEEGAPFDSLGSWAPPSAAPEPPSQSVLPALEPDTRLYGKVQRLDARHVPASRLGAVIASGVLLVGAAVGGTIFWFAADEIAARWKVAILVAAAILVLIHVSLGLLWPRLELSRTRWRIGPEGLEIRRGVVWRHVITVPSSRIQHTDVGQGPIERRFGLATLTVHTAGTHEYEIDLEGIAHDVAFQVRDELLAMRGERDGDGA